MGRAGWTHVEPPITIGRGLLITTGAIGGLLSLAVLWAMLPSTGRGGEAAPTVVTSTSNTLSSPIISTRADTLVATSIDGRTPATTARVVPLNAPAESDQSSTTTSDRPAPTNSTEAAEFVESPIAVGIGDSLVITTARAVRGRTFLTLTGADGQPHDATVLMVDRDLGLAVLSADPSATTQSYGIGPAASAGDVVTVLGSTPTSANVSMNADGHLTLDSWASPMSEGTPVLNADGQLVAMCSHGASGPELVSVANVGAMLPGTNSTAPWLGVHVAVNDQGALMITGIDLNSPAATAGLVPGDAITEIDGAPIGTVDQLKATIAQHAPNDVVALTIVHADQTSGDVDVTLVTAPSM
jgi:S1-C subfamily serine protease